MPIPNPGILDSVPFKLKVFRNEVFELETVLLFLASQPHIIVWHQIPASPADEPRKIRHDGPLRVPVWFQTAPTPVHVPDEFLPNLAQVHFPPWMIPKFTSRLLTHISTHIVEETSVREREILDSLEGYSGTLTSLEIEREGIPECMPLAEFVDYLSPKVPLLESLGLWNTDAADRVSSFQFLMLQELNHFISNVNLLFKM